MINLSNCVFFLLSYHCRDQWMLQGPVLSFKRGIYSNSHINYVKEKLKCRRWNVDWKFCFAYKLIILYYGGYLIFNHLHHMNSVVISGNIHLTMCVGGGSQWGSTESRRDYIKMEAHCTESQQMKIRKTWKQKKKKVSVFTLTIRAIPSLSRDIQRSRNRRETLQAEERGGHLCPWCSCTYQSWLTRAW